MLPFLLFFGVVFGLPPLVLPKKWAFVFCAVLGLLMALLWGHHLYLRFSHQNSGTIAEAMGLGFMLLAAMFLGGAALLRGLAELAWRLYRAAIARRQ